MGRNLLRLVVHAVSASERSKWIARASIAGSGECWPWQGAKTSEGYGDPRIEWDEVQVDRDEWAKFRAALAALDEKLGAA